MDVSYRSSPDGVTATDWRRLAERAGHVFATREWLLTWWRHYGNGHRQLTGLAHAGGDLVAGSSMTLINSWLALRAPKSMYA